MNTFINAMLIGLGASISFFAQADTTYIHYEGVVTKANNYFSEAKPMPHQVGDAISGTFAINHAYVDTYIPSSDGQYNTPTNGGTLIYYLDNEGLADQRFITGFFDDSIAHQRSNDMLRLQDGETQDSLSIRNGYRNGGPEMMRANDESYIVMSFHNPDFLDGIGLAQNADVVFETDGGRGSGTIRQRTDYATEMHRYHRDIEPTGTVQFELTRVRIETVAGEEQTFSEYCPIP